MVNSSKKGRALDWNLLMRVLSFTKSFRKVFLLTAFLTVFAALISPIRPYLIQYTVDHFVLLGDLNGLAIMTVIMVGTLVLESLVMYAQTYYSGWVGQTVIRDIRSRLFGHLLNFRLGYFDRSPIGTLVTRVINDLETVANIFSEGLLSIAGDLLKLIIVLAWMFAISPTMTLISLIPVPLLILATWMFKNGIRKAFNEVRNEVANLNAFAQEHITGMNLVQAFNRQDVEQEAFERINKRHRKAHIKSVWYYSVFFPVVEVLQAISIALVVWWGAREIMTHPDAGLQPGAIFSFILWIYMLYRPMRQLADRFNTLQMGMVSCERIFDLLDRDESMPDKGTTPLEQVKGHIRFEAVHFEYLPGEPVLRGIDLDIQPGEKIAIVGSTGSGKSTLIQLLTRLYETKEGCIRLDGKDIHAYPLSRLRQAVGMVSQDVFLFSDTLANNIRLYQPDISLEQIQAAAEEVGAQSFIERLPGGLQFQVGERGAALSVGQRQLIAFIRACVFNPAVLVLDEATSSIDSESEALIQQATERITKGRTSIIIAHRLSTVVDADRILVMDRGRIVESGSHRALLAQEGAYKRLFELQFAVES